MEHHQLVELAKPNRLSPIGLGAGIQTHRAKARALMYVGAYMYQLFGRGVCVVLVWFKYTCVCAQVFIVCMYKGVLREIYSPLLSNTPLV